MHEQAISQAGHLVIIPCPKVSATASQDVKHINVTRSSCCQDARSLELRCQLCSSSNQHVYNNDIVNSHCIFNGRTTPPAFTASS